MATLLVLAVAVTASPASTSADVSRSSHPAAVTYSFVPTGSMTVIRNRLIAASPLPNGKVLIAGGEDMNPGTSAESYDPISGTFSASGVGPMQRPLVHHWLTTRDVVTVSG